MATVNFMQPDLQLDQDQIARNRQIADMLRQQSQTPMQGQMVGQIYVPPSWTQGLAKLVQGYQSGQMNKQADTDSRALAAQLMQRNQSDAQNFMNAVQGSTPEQQGNNPSAYTPAQQGSPDFQKAISIGMQNPMLMPMAQKLMEQRMVPKVPKWEKVEKPNPDGSTTLGYVDANSPNPWATFQPGGTGPVKGIAVNGQIVNPFQMGQTIPKQAEAPNPGTNLVIPGPGGEMVPNKPLIEARRAIANAGKTDVTVNTEKGYAGAMAKGLAEQDLAAIDAGNAAPQRIQSARAVKSFLAKNPITGTGAEARLAFEKALATAGLIDGVAVKNTEGLAAELASQTLDAIKTSGLGGGQGFTDKDRQFLERAKSGNIKINMETLRYLADKNEQAGMASIKRANDVIGRLKKNKTMGDVGLNVPEIPTSEPQKVRTYNPATGRIE